MNQMDFIEHSLQLLKEKDYKMTGPRMAVLGVLEKAEIPLSAYDIEERIPENISINVVTIYRVLDIFEKLGIAHRVHSKEGFVRCDFEGQKGCHFFAVCNECSRASEFINDACTMDDIIPKDLPFKNLKHLSEITGVCNYCTLSSKSK